LIYCSDGAPPPAQRLDALRERIEAVEDFRSAVLVSDLVVTATPSRSFFLRSEDVAPGAFVAAVGADSPEKQEVDPRLVASAKLVVDIREQCAEIGELHHAIAQGLLRPQEAHAALSEIVAARRPGRQTEEEIIVFDSTGTALQDLAAAAAAYERALAWGAGIRVEIGSWPPKADGAGRSAAGLLGSRAR
jgi:alanine dehydrogenase